MECFEKEKFDLPIEGLHLGSAESLHPEQTVLEAVRMMQTRHFGSVLITKDDQLVGILTEKDLLKKIPSDGVDLAGLKVEEIMTPDPISLNKQDNIRTALLKMIRHDFRHLPILYPSEKVRMLSAKDILKFIVDGFPKSVYALGMTSAKELYIEDAHDDAFAKEILESTGKFIGQSTFWLPLMKVISNDCLSLDITTPLEVVLEKMQKNNCEAAIITDFETEVRGIITERDFLFKVFGKKILGQRHEVCRYMTPDPDSLLAKHKIAYAINNMFTRNYRHVVIVNEDGHPLSLISLLDILSFISRRLILSPSAVE